jgi:hypothetical protein
VAGGLSGLTSPGSGRVPKNAVNPSVEAPGAASMPRTFFRTRPEPAALSPRFSPQQRSHRSVRQRRRQQAKHQRCHDVACGGANGTALDQLQRLERESGERREACRRSAACAAPGGRAADWRERTGRRAHPRPGSPARSRATCPRETCSPPGDPRASRRAVGSRRRVRCRRRRAGTNASWVRAEKSPVRIGWLHPGAAWSNPCSPQQFKPQRGAARARC